MGPEQGEGEEDEEGKVGEDGGREGRGEREASLGPGSRVPHLPPLLPRQPGQSRPCPGVLQGLMTGIPSL